MASNFIHWLSSKGQRRVLSKKTYENVKYSPSKSFYSLQLQSQKPMKNLFAISKARKKSCNSSSVFALGSLYLSKGEWRGDPFEMKMFDVRHKGHGVHIWKISSIRSAFLQAHKRAERRKMWNSFCEKGLTLQSTSMDACQVALKQKAESTEWLKENSNNPPLNILSIEAAAMFMRLAISCNHSSSFLTIIAKWTSTNLFSFPRKWFQVAQHFTRLVSTAKVFLPTPCEKL